MSARGAVGKTLAAHLLACELALLDPATRRDRKRVTVLLARDFCEFGASGRAWSRSEILTLLETEDYEPPIIEDFSCRHIADGVVLVTYRTVRPDAKTGHKRTVLRSSLWQKEKDRWRVRFHQGTRGLERGR
jgi:hypothetical protein